jgi:phosphinothricin acetyltransferase
VASLGSEELVCIVVHLMRSEHREAVRAIYEEGIATGNATFEQRVATWEESDAAHLPICRLVAPQAQRVVAWAARTPVSEGCVRSGGAEVSTYIADSARGMEIEWTLLQALV